MIEYGSTIRLQHEYAMRFFEEAMNPDMEELRQRDTFLASLEQECPVRIESGDLVAEIPDIDIAALLGSQSGYIAVNDDSYKVSVDEKSRNQQSHSTYCPISIVMIKIAA